MRFMLIALLSGCSCHAQCGSQVVVSDDAAPDAIVEAVATMPDAKVAPSPPSRKWRDDGATVGPLRKFNYSERKRQIQLDLAQEHKDP